MILIASITNFTSLRSKKLQKYNSRTIGIFFVLVAISLIADFYKFGHRPETWHKMFHVIVGIFVLKFGWSNEKFWKPFCLINGAFFTYVALFGFAFPDFGGLDAFNALDRILHLIVGLSGLLIGLF